MTHYGIPWPLFRSLYRALRKYFFTIDPPSGSHLRTEATIPQLRRAFGQAHFTNSWELSYHYAGEDLNMRRPDYDATDARPWKQTHVRGFDHDNHRKLFAHFEYEPTEYPDAHLHTENLDTTEGLDRVGSVLDAAGIAYEVV